MLMKIKWAVQTRGMRDMNWNPPTNHVHSCRALQCMTRAVKMISTAEGAYPVNIGRPLQKSGALTDGKDGEENWGKSPELQSRHGRVLDEEVDSAIAGPDEQGSDHDENDDATERNDGNGAAVPGWMRRVDVTDEVGPKAIVYRDSRWLRLHCISAVA